MMKAHTPAFSLDNDALPYVICDRCRLLLLYLNKNPGNERNRKLPPAPNYDDITPPTPLTRNSQECQCGICNVSRTQLSQDHKAALSKFIFTSQTAASSASRTSVSSDSESPTVSTQTRCVKCETWVGKGKPHNCSKNTRLENMSRMIKRVSPCTRQKLIGVALSKELQEVTI